MFIAFVRVEGLEPPSLAALDPKSSVSTNFTTPATQKRSAKVRILLHNQSLFEIFFEIFFSVSQAMPSRHQRNMGS